MTIYIILTKLLLDKDLRIALVGNCRVTRPLAANSALLFDKDTSKSSCGGTARSNSSFTGNFRSTVATFSSSKQSSVSDKSAPSC